MGTHISHSFLVYKTHLSKYYIFVFPWFLPHLLFVLYLVPSVVETQVASMG